MTGLGHVTLAALPPVVIGSGDLLADSFFIEFIFQRLNAKQRGMLLDDDCHPIYSENKGAWGLLSPSEELKWKMRPPGQTPVVEDLDVRLGVHLKGEHRVTWRGSTRPPHQLKVVSRPGRRRVGRAQGAWKPTAWLVSSSPLLGACSGRASWGKLPSSSAPPATPGPGTPFLGQSLSSSQ